jgi:MFS transporter, Spinster family, sphingosine-1-phosphate transporter
VLTAMNLLNYLDRYVPSAVKKLFKEDLGLTDAQTSLPLTAFIVVYMLTSPIFGALADRGPRRLLVGLGVALWSVATALAAMANGFWFFLFARSLVGVGEAAYATIAPSLISDFYPPERRNKILTIFYVAIPVGSALGFTLGGFIGGAYGWRAAFLVCGLPGVLFAILALLMRDPGRGGFAAAGKPEALEPRGEPVDWRFALRAMGRSREYVCAVAGYTAVTFAAGGLADWLPEYLARKRGMELESAGALIGTVTVLGGLGGTICGGLLAEKLKKVTRQGYLALAGLSMIPATIFALLALVLPAPQLVIGGLILLAQFFLWFYNGPINAMIANSVPSAIVARAFAVSILSIHLFGDAISPPIIGLISDMTNDLGLAVLIVPATMAIGAIVWCWGWRTIPERRGTEG